MLITTVSTAAIDILIMIWLRNKLGKLHVGSFKHAVKSIKKQFLAFILAYVAYMTTVLIDYFKPAFLTNMGLYSPNLFLKESVYCIPILYILIVHW